MENKEKKILVVAKDETPEEKHDYNLIHETLDGAGYDVLSYTLEGDKKFIEVKTTRGSSKTPFYMSSNELEFSKAHQDRYYLYRVYSFEIKTNSGKLYKVSGLVDDHFALVPVQFRVH